jgi:glucan phosphoethanolaminetransferase (alkaline phosphatase superfamily)
MYVNFYAVVPCIIFLMILVLVDTRKTSGLKAFLLANVLLIGCFLVTPVLIDQKFPTISTAAFYRTCTEFLTQNPVSNRVFAAHNGDARARREVLKPALPDDFRPSNNIVVVVDESVRGDHLSLNGYERDTTPFLREMYRRGILTNWGIASSASTGSRYTYNALITGLTPNDFPDKSDTRITTFPTLFQYAKAMRYRTYFFDGQMKDYWGANYDDKRWIDAWSGPKEIADGRGFAPYELDNLIARKINALVTASAGNFIFVFKHGSHMPYSSDFPADAAYWQPSYRTDNTFSIPQSADLPAVVNSYDNSLRYNIDSFFRNLIDDYANIPNNTVILYTGDHGQTLFANGRAAHGGSTKEEATVPLFIVGKLAASPDTRYRASHQNLFPTILDLMAYPQELRNWTDVPSLLKAGAADSRQRSFNPDLGLKVAFD